MILIPALRGPKRYSLFRINLRRGASFYMRAGFWVFGNNQALLIMHHPTLLWNPHARYRKAVVKKTYGRRCRYQCPKTDWFSTRKALAIFYADSSWKKMRRFVKHEEKGIRILAQTSYTFSLRSKDLVDILFILGNLMLNSHIFKLSLCKILIESQKCIC